MAMTYNLWRLVAVKDEHRSTWELVATVPSLKQAKGRIYDLAGTNIVSPDEDVYWYEDADGRHTFRIEALLVKAPAAAAAD
jgi:hypothetical protein